MRTASHKPTTIDLHFQGCTGWQAALAIIAALVFCVVTSHRGVFAQQATTDHTANAERALSHTLLENSMQLWSQGNWQDALAQADFKSTTRLTPQEREQLAQASELDEEFFRLYQQGKHDEALPVAKKSLDIRRQLLGEEHPDYATSLNNLAALYRAMGVYRPAEPLFRQALAIRKETLGEEHPRYAISLNNLAALYDSMGDYAQAEPLYQEAVAIQKRVLGETHLHYAQSLHNLASMYESMGDFARAEPLFQQAVAIRKEALGDKHPDYASSLDKLAELYASINDYRRAEELYLEALTIKKDALGEGHPRYAFSLNNLAALYHSMGNYQQAEGLYQRVLGIFEKARWTEHPDYAATLHNLGRLYEEIGDYAAAESLYQQALAIRKTALGEEHIQYAQSLNDMAGMYLSMGDYARAIPFYRHALATKEKAVGKWHPSYASTLNGLGVLYCSTGDIQRAEQLWQEALGIWNEALGENHRDYALGLSNLAFLYSLRGDYSRAERLYDQALAIEKKVLGERHPHYGTTLNNLAGVYESMRDFQRAEAHYLEALVVWKEAFGTKHRRYAVGLNNLSALYSSRGNFQQAEPLCEEALAIWKQSLGQEHPVYATSLSNLASLYVSKGDDVRAEQLFRQSLAITGNVLELVSDVQSERQQRSILERSRPELDGYLSLSVHSGRHAESAYVQLLAWKGIVTSRQRRLRVVLAEPELSAMFGKLQATTAHLATLTLAVPNSEQRNAWQRHLEELSLEKEKLEAELSDTSRAFREAKRQVTMIELQQALPPGAVLVDFMEYVDYGGKVATGERPRQEQRLLVFVVGRDKLVGPISLVSVAELNERTKAWGRGYGGTGESAVAGRWLRERLWEPLEEHLLDAKVVILSPDGALGRLPLAALPGKREGTFLLEDVPLAVVPVPQLLPELLRDNTSNDTGSCLLVGGVDYDAPPEALPQSRASVVPDQAALLASRRRSAARDWDSDTRFEPLVRTGDEIQKIDKSFKLKFPNGTTQILQGRQATEVMFKELAPRHRYIHLATHGYFAPPSLRSALAPRREPSADLLVFDREFDVAGFHPGLLSGLALAGANEQVDPDQEDGILTAEEVATMNLSDVDLAVLSACETGLGETAGGEGLLGLQRAFQVAGARTVVASLWKVDDEVTHQLMTRFYDNLWRKRMGKLQALREAQLSILNADPEEFGFRSLSPESQPLPHDGELPRTHPRLWATWVLSGDPGDLSFATEPPERGYATAATPDDTQPATGIDNDALHTTGEANGSVLVYLLPLAAGLVVVIVVAAALLVRINRKL